MGITGILLEGQEIIGLRRRIKVIQWDLMEFRNPPILTPLFKCHNLIYQDWVNINNIDIWGNKYVITIKI